MGYVNLERRRKENLAKEDANLRLERLRRAVVGDPRLSIIAGSAIGVPYFAVIGPEVLFNGYPLGYAVLWLLPAILGAALACRGLRLLGRRGPKTRRPNPGAEKQLLLTMRDTGGGITPVEAALETSLTVDEAETILSRLAERGHLRIECREGILCYTLPEASREAPPTA